MHIQEASQIPVGRFNISLGREELVLETGRLAKQADGAVTVAYGGTVVLVTACVSKEPIEGIDFVPLTVEYREKTYAAGRIPGGFFKREGRPSENEILTARLIDRPIRPLFPKGFSHEIQVMGLVLSSDGENDPDVLSLIGASVALGISCIPFAGPISACRVGLVEGNFLLNPTYKEREKASLDLVVAASEEGIIMLEAKATQLKEPQVVSALDFALPHLKKIIEFQKKIIADLGKTKIATQAKTVPPALLEKVKSLATDKLDQIYKISEKDKREEAIATLAKELEEALIKEDDPDAPSPEEVKAALVEVERQQVRGVIIGTGLRIDGRALTDIRPITCEIGVLPRTHGSSLFTRGQTQSLAVTTLGSSSDEQLIEALEGESSKSFMLHYSFPPFSVGEVKPVRGPGRREIGHGALAEKAIFSLMPSKEEFPYTVRVVSEILESNGSSSMATVCAASLALMDAGVPIKETVAGVALGLIREKDKELVLTDVTGLEDHFGDMDFKVAGTREGITVIQLDLKIGGINLGLIEKILKQARDARQAILEKMSVTIARPRPNLSVFAPRITTLRINPDKVGELIGPGGKNIRKIIKLTGATIDIEDDGLVMVSSTEAEATQKALEMIHGLTDEPEVGKLYKGRITRLMNFGAFCEILPNKEGLIHISELSTSFVKNVEDVVRVGDAVEVKVIGIDDLGRVNLSMKQVPASK